MNVLFSFWCEAESFTPKKKKSHFKSWNMRVRSDPVVTRHNCGTAGAQMKLMVFST